GQFPNYEAVLPRDNTKVVELDKEKTAAAVRRVALLADERSHAIRMQVDKDKVEIFSSSGEYGEAHEVLDATYDKDSRKMGFIYKSPLDFRGGGGEGGKFLWELKD